MTRASAARPAGASRAERSPRRSGGGTLLGVFIGLVLGLALAAGVAFYVTGGWRTYQSQIGPRDAAKDAGKDGKGAKADDGGRRFDFYKILPGHDESKAQADRKPAEKAPDRATTERAAKPEAEKPAPSEATTQPPATTPPAPAPTAPATAERKPALDAGKVASGERYWLQAGSFASEADAENLKARLALAGWEASVQQGVVPDLGTRFRVRLGPYDNVDEINRLKGELARRGFDVAVMRN